MRGAGFEGFLAGWPPPEVAACRCGRDHAIGTRSVRLGPALLDGLDSLIPAPGRGEGPVLLLADPETFEAAGSRAAARLRGAGIRLRESVLPSRPHADDRTLDRLRRELVCGPSRIVAVGSGTISDLGKALAAAARVPLATVGTAASMNGYTSTIAALTVAGLKVTLPVPAPDVVVLDTGVLAAAPIRLTRAGFGDLCSKPVSGADWVLSNRVLGEPVCDGAQALADGAVERARARAEGIGGGETEAVSALAEALVISGLSMAAAGVSSPASGGEHLISHYLDISASGWGREPRLHGEQVAVGTMVSLALYERLRGAGPPGALSDEPAEESDADLARLHAHLAPGVRESVRREAGAKRDRPPVRSERRETLRVSWDVLWRDLDAQLAPARGLRHDLVDAGVPVTFEAIGVARRTAAATVRLARHMRNRYTVLDAASDLADLEAWSTEVVAAVEGSR